MKATDTIGDGIPTAGALLELELLKSSSKAVATARTPSRTTSPAEGVPLLPCRQALSFTCCREWERLESRECYLSERVHGWTFYRRLKDAHYLPSRRDFHLSLAERENERGEHRRSEQPGCSPTASNYRAGTTGHAMGVVSGP